MFKSDIKVNYSVIDGIAKEALKYANALSEVENCVDTIHGIVENENEGQAAKALNELYNKIEGRIDKVGRELTDIVNIFNGYSRDMQSIIKPIDYHQMTQVDRTDIWWNMQDIKRACKSIGNIKNNVREPYSLFLLEDDKKEIEKQKRNFKKIKEAQRLISRAASKLDDKVNEMNNLFNRKVVLMKIWMMRMKKKLKNYILNIQINWN